MGAVDFGKTTIMATKNDLVIKAWMDSVRQPLTWWQYLCQVPITSGLVASRTPVSRLFDRIPRCILLTGLDEAGKSTILARYLAQNQDGHDIRQHKPFIGGLVEEVCFGAVRFQASDIGGCRPRGIRRFEETLVHRADAVIYVINAADRDRMMESREEFLMTVLLALGGMRKGVPLLVLANKQDLRVKMARTPVQLEQYFIHNVSTSIGDRPWHISGTNALTGEGILEAFEWLSQQLDGESPSSGSVVSTEKEKGTYHEGGDEKN